MLILNHPVLLCGGSGACNYEGLYTYSFVHPFGFIPSAGPHPPVSTSSMPSFYWRIKNIYVRLQRTIQKECFFDRYRENKLIPEGIRTSFNLAFSIHDDCLFQGIYDILNNCSSNILNAVYENSVQIIERLEKELLATRSEVSLILGVHKTNELIGAIRKDSKHELAEARHRLSREETL